MASLEKRSQKKDVIQTWKVLNSNGNVTENHWLKRSIENHGLETTMSSNSLDLRHKPYVDILIV